MGAGLAVGAPLVGVPLTVMTFYLKGLREQQTGRFSDLAERVNAASEELRRVVEDVAQIQRSFATKEEWLRETMWARGRIESLSAAVMRAETELESQGGLVATSERTHRLVVEMAKHVGIDGLRSQGRDDGESR
jgi:DNA-binding transcriptional regulator YbjK